MRELIALICEKCKRKNYTTDKNRKSASGKVSLSKYCRHCREHVDHKEGKVK